MNFCDIKRDVSGIKNKDCIYPHASVVGSIGCFHLSPTKYLGCTRPEGHEGPHCGCGITIHVFAE